MSASLIKSEGISETRVRRGRPRGAVKTFDARVRDRVKTMAMLRALYLRVTVVDNVNQFSRWFDQRMRALHPGRAWESESRNKWRKNFRGDVSMAEESRSFLRELFPDGRFYVATTRSDAGKGVEYADTGMEQGEWGEVSLMTSPADCLFRFGPGRLWSAIWDGESGSDQLWQLYPATGAYGESWGDARKIDALLEVLGQKLTNAERRDPNAVQLADLGRAVVMYRRLLRDELHDVCAAIESYVIVHRALMACQSSLRLLSVYEDIRRYFTHMERERIASNPRYVEALRYWYHHSELFDVDAHIDSPINCELVCT